jgi:hypothetical protein
MPQVGFSKTDRCERHTLVSGELSDAHGYGKRTMRKAYRERLHFWKYKRITSYQPASWQQ